MPNNFDAIVPEIWSREILYARNQAQVIAPTVMKPDEAEFAEGDTINFPVTSKHTITNGTTDGTSNSASARTATVVPLVIDKFRGAYAFYGKKELRQIANSARYAEGEQAQMGIDLMEDLEYQLYLKMVAGAGSTLGTQGGGLTKDLIIAINGAFDAAKAPANDRWLVLPVAGKQDLLGITEFTKQNEGGDRAKALTTFSEVGENFVGQFFGLNIIWTTAIPANGDSPVGYTAIAYHGTAVGLAIQQAVDVVTQVGALKNGVDVAATTLYGAKVLRSAEVFKVLI